MHGYFLYLHHDSVTSVLHITSVSILYQLFYFLHKKCTEGHLPCTNGISNIQKAGMKRCGQRAALADRREPLAGEVPLEED